MFAIFLEINMPKKIMLSLLDGVYVVSLALLIYWHGAFAASSGYTYARMQAAGLTSTYAYEPKTPALKYLFMEYHAAKDAGNYA